MQHVLEFHQSAWQTLHWKKYFWSKFSFYFILFVLIVFSQQLWSTKRTTRPAAWFCRWNGFVWIYTYGRWKLYRSEKGHCYSVSSVYGNILQKIYFHTRVLVFLADIGKFCFVIVSSIEKSNLEFCRSLSLLLLLFAVLWLSMARYQRLTDLDSTLGPRSRYRSPTLRTRLCYYRQGIFKRMRQVHSNRH